MSLIGLAIGSEMFPRETREELAWRHFCRQLVEKRL